MARWSQRRSVWLATACVGAVALLALVLDHRAHVLGVLPYLLLLACPLMHLGHGNQHSHSSEMSQGQSEKRSSAGWAGDAPEGGQL
jgi:Protein of unknown function (DUF2933)